MHTVRETRVFLLLQVGGDAISSDCTLSLVVVQGAYIIQRSIRSDRASRLQVTHLAHDRRNTARAEPRGAASDQFSECAEELAFGECGLERKEMTEDTDDHQQFLCWVALHEREECRVQRIRYFELVRVLSQEKHTFIDQLADNETQDFSQITTGDQFLFLL